MIASTSYRRDGFTLLVTLLLISLTAAMLARLASRGLAMTLEARTRSEALQEKWAIISSRLAVAENADLLFGDLDAFYETEGLGWPYPCQIEGNFSVGGVEYHLLLIDEQAKLNLNAIYEHQPNSLSQLLQDAQREVTTAIPLLSEAAHPHLVTNQKKPYQSLGQVVDLSKMRLNSKTIVDLLKYSQHFSCCGKTRLNLQRASDEALRQTVRLVLTQAETERLVEARIGYSGELSDWLRSIDIPSRRLLPLRRLLGVESQSYSLWLTSEKGIVLTSKGDALGNSKNRVLQWP